MTKVGKWNKNIPISKFTVEMETKAEEPEHYFLLEERVTSLLLFHTWSVRNFKLKGQELFYDEDGVLHPILNTSDSVSVKVPASEHDGKPFVIQMTCSKGKVYFFNAISEAVREQCIAIFNFSARTPKWFYPFEETIYKDHETMEVIGLPIKKPIYVPTKVTANVVEMKNDEKRAILKQKIDSNKSSSRSNSPINRTTVVSNSPMPTSRSNSPMANRSKSPMKIHTTISNASLDPTTPGIDSNNGYKIGGDIGSPLSTAEST